MNLPKLIDQINTELDQIAAKYNIYNQSQQTYTLGQTIQLLDKLDKIKSETKLTIQPNTLQNLTTQLETQLYEQESTNVDHILNEIIECARTEIYESRILCTKQIQKILDENYLKSNIKNKLKALVELLVKN